MTKLEYLECQLHLLVAAEMIRKLPLDNFIEQARQADNVGPVLDPTLYQQQLRKIIAIAEEAQRLQIIMEIYSPEQHACFPKADGSVATDRSLEQKSHCYYCGRLAPFLCDFAAESGAKTCDRAICESCATHPKRGIDYCKIHGAE